MKVLLANVGSVYLWAEVAKGKVALIMESQLAGQPRSIGMLLMLDDLMLFKTRVQSALREALK